MIVGVRKPFEEILAMVGPCERLLIVGCGTCVAVCMAGGKKEVELLASQLRLKAKTEGREIEIEEECVDRQCEREFLEGIKDKVESHELILSMACGAGVQFMAELFPDKRILPCLNTTFIGVVEAEGRWRENCAACGDCMLAITEGVCPVARCSKSLLNGPCGGSQEGQCEVSKEIACGWQLIYDRLERLGMKEKLLEIRPPKDWSKSYHGGPRRAKREDVAL